MGGKAKKYHEVVPFDFGVSEFSMDLPHFGYDLPKVDSEEGRQEVAWYKKHRMKGTWQGCLMAVSDGDALVVHGHCNGGLTLKSGRGLVQGTWPNVRFSSETISPADLARKLQGLTGNCHIVIWACVSLPFAVSFARLWQKGGGKAIEYYGTTKLVDRVHFDPTEKALVRVGDNPDKIDLTKLSAHLKDVGKKEHEERWVSLPKPPTPRFGRKWRPKLKPYKPPPQIKK